METNFKLEDFKVNDIIMAMQGDRYIICQIYNVDEFTREIFSNVLHSSFETIADNCTFRLVNDYFEIVQNYGNITFEEFKEQYPEEFI